MVRSILLITLILLYISGISSAVAVLSIDLGSEFLKIAIVKPGVPMEIVLNKESKRKTPAVISMFRDERTLGDTALSKVVRSPETAFWYLSRIIGLNHTDPYVQQYQKLFPYYNIVPEEKTGLISFKLHDNLQYTVEELMAMLLEYCKHLAEEYGEQPVKDVVITVPSYFTQAQRRALIRAASLANINVLQLMNDNAAVALNYGVFRAKSFNSTPQYYLFYDMGSTSTTATVVSYQLVKGKEGGYVSEYPQLSVKGVGFDRSLGGLDFQLRLRDHLLNEFSAMKKTSSDISKNKRAMAKLFKEAGRIKHILSANPFHYAQIESLIDDQDYRVKVTRSEFEEMCTDLFERSTFPVELALKSSQIPLSEIKEVILMGGGMRIPKIQKELLSYVKKSDLSKSINSDEAAAMGAVYQAADHSVGFKVKKFIVKDAALFPIEVEFAKSRTSQRREHRMTRRTLFSHMNPYPQKKVMTFSKQVEDFDFSIKYGDISFIDQSFSEAIQSDLISQIKLSGISDALAKHVGSTYKGVKAHFVMDDSGILTVKNIESVFETVASESQEEEESTLSKLGSTFSSFFGGSSDSKNDTADTAEKNDTIHPMNGTNATVGNITKSTNVTDKQSKELKSVMLREPVVMKVTQLDFNDPSVNDIEVSRTVLVELTKKDEDRKRREKAHNTLESLLFDVKDKMSEDIYKASSTPDEKAQIKKNLLVVSDWLDEQSPMITTADQYDAKIAIIHSLIRDVFSRVKEHSLRPSSVKELLSILNYTDHFLIGLQAIVLNDSEVFTPIEISTLEKLVKDTYKWKDDILSEQEKKPLYEKPIVTQTDFEDKYRALQREVNYLINKAKNYVPKPKTTTTKKTPTADDNSTILNDSSSQINDSQSNNTENKADESSTVDDASIKTEKTTLNSSRKDETQQSTTSKQEKHQSGHDPDDEL